MPELTNDLFILMKYISTEGKTSSEVLEFQPDGIYWEYMLTSKLLKELEWAKLISEENHILKLNNKGKLVMECYETKVEKEKQAEAIALRKLHIDVRNAERISKTYWLTFSMAVAAFLISLVLLIIKLEEL